MQKSDSQRDAAAPESSDSDINPPKEIFVIDDTFKIERYKSVNDLGVEVYSATLFKDGVKIMNSASMASEFPEPTSIYTQYLEIKEEEAAKEKEFRDYQQSSTEEKRAYLNFWATKIACQGDRFLGIPTVNIADIRKKEPEVDQYVDAMISSVADLLEISYEEALDQFFQLDEESTAYLKRLPKNVDLVEETAVEETGNCPSNTPMITNEITGSQTALSIRMKKVLIVVANIPPLLTLVVWPLMVFLSLFAFDDPKATSSIPTLAIVVAVWVYPVPVVMGLWRIWKALRACDLSGCTRTTLFAYVGPLLVVGMYIILVWLSH